MRRDTVFGIMAFSVFAATASAATLNVPSEYPRIQAAIQVAVDGDVVLVAPGVYYETINFGGRDIVVTGTDPNDPKVVGYTIINADEDGTAVTFDNGETPAAVLTGFTITGGFGTYSQEFTNEVGVRTFGGAGIYCYYASPTRCHDRFRRGHRLLRGQSGDYAQHHSTEQCLRGRRYSVLVWLADDSQ